MGAKEVAAGAAWLDENFPGWEREIDLGTLNIGLCSDCVLGQSLRDYVGVVISQDREYWGSDTGWHYGVSLQDHQLERGLIDNDTYDLIGMAFVLGENEPLWRELIKERFSAGNLSDNGDS